MATRLVSTNMMNTKAESNTLQISLHLLPSTPSTTINSNTTYNRSTLFTKLSQTCQFVNRHLQQITWGCGGDGLVFGVHCADADDTNANDDNCDSYDWQEHLEHVVHNKRKNTDRATPHLRAIYPYKNDMNATWHVISTLLQLSTLLSSNQMHTAIECLDQDVGQILLIEAAEVLPNWVEEDPSQGGVGGAQGCVNRCWIVDGKVRLIPPDTNDVCLRREEALSLLRQCVDSDVFVDEEVQDAVERRIGMVDYSVERSRPNKSAIYSTVNGDNDDDAKNEPRHFHVAAAALPASVAYFFKTHSHLVPFCVDKFCEVAPLYVEEIEKRRRKNASLKDNAAKNWKPLATGAASTGGTELNTNKSQACTPNSSHSKEHNLSKSTQTKNTTPGNHITYENLTLLPITLTRTTYAELITCRGLLPHFPIPNEYKCIELNRFQRQLMQLTGEKWRRAVDVGVRLCLGLEWILNDTTAVGVVGATQNENVNDDFTQCMSQVERRLRLHWCRIDAEFLHSIKSISTHYNSTDKTSTCWIEEMWQAGPNNTQESLNEAIQQMSNCPVFNPELSKPRIKEPCPLSRPSVSLHKMIQMGLDRAKRWVRQEYDEDYFPFPREWEVDDDTWMEVNSLEELEEEMQKLERKPRRRTRRSRRIGVQELHDNEEKEPSCAYENSQSKDVEGSDSQDVTSLNKMLHGFKSLVEGEGELEGVVTQQISTCLDCVSPHQAMAQKVTINARLFLDILQDKLQHGTKDTNEEVDVSKYFFKEDLEDDDSVHSTSSIDKECDGDQSMECIMQAMDEEVHNQNTKDGQINAHHDFEMISNLLHSLEAEEDVPGPVRNILREMGVCPPRLPPNK